MPPAKPPIGSKVRDFGGAPSLWLRMAGPERTFASDSGDVADAIGAARAGIRPSGITWADGPRGKCLAFDGTAQLDTGFVGIGPTGTIIIELTPSRAWNSGVQELPWTASNLSFNHFSDNTLYVGWSSPSDSRVVVAATAATWPQGVRTAFAFAWSAGTPARLYAAGALIAVAGSNTTTDVTSSLRIGVASSSSFAGQVHDFRAYPRALSAAEVAREYFDPDWRLRRPGRRAVASIPAVPWCVGDDGTTSPGYFEA